MDATKEVSPEVSRPMDVGPSNDGGRRKWVWIALASIVLAAGLGWAFWPNDPAKNETRAARVPRVVGGEIVLPDEFAKVIGLEGTRVRKQALVPVVRAVGTITFDPAHVQAVGTRIRGLVTRLHHLEGDHVKQGDVLAEIASAELADAQAEVEVAEANKEAAERNAARETELAQMRLTTAVEAEQAERELKEQTARLLAAKRRAKAFGADTSAQLGTYSLVASLEGTVVERHVSPGQAVEPNLVAFRVADLDHLWVELKVPESRIAAIRLGDRVQLHPIANPEQGIEGTVAHVGEVIDPSTRMADVRIEVNNTARRVRVGQSVAARIKATGPAHQALVVPESAVTQIDGRTAVFLMLGKNRVRRQYVEVGGTDGVHSEILEGLREGQQIVTKGVFALKSELYR